MKFKGLKESCMKESVQNTTNMTFIYVMPLQENENGVVSNGYVYKTKNCKLYVYLNIVK